MVEEKTHNPGTKRLDLNKYFMQAVDRAYFRAFPGNIRGQSTSNTYDSNHLTRKEFLENPELFYKKPDRTPEFSITRLSVIKDIEVFNVKFPSPVQTKHTENNIAHGLLFKNKVKDSPTSLILLPGWGKINLWEEKKIALSLAKNNIDCFILKLPFHFERAPGGAWSGEYALTGDLQRTVEGTRQLVVEVRTVNSWLRKRAKKVVISGISLGGMMAHLAMAVEAFDAGITILAGGNNASIIWEGIGTRRVKENIIRAGFTREQVNHVFQIINPTILAKHNKTRNTLMMNGLYDEVIPARFTNELWEALGRPKIKWYPCAHLNIIFFMKTVVKDMIQFIHETI